MEDGLEFEPDNKNISELETPIDQDQKPTTVMDVHPPVEVKDEFTSSSDDESLQPLLEQPTILEGKRSRKPTARLELGALTPSKRTLTIPQVKLGSYPFATLSCGV